jgi:hypothetical protein
MDVFFKITLIKAVTWWTNWTKSLLRPSGGNCSKLEHHLVEIVNNLPKWWFAQHME